MAEEDVYVPSPLPGSSFILSLPHQLTLLSIDGVSIEKAQAPSQICVMRVSPANHIMFKSPTRHSSPRYALSAGRRWWRARLDIHHRIFHHRPSPSIQAPCSTQPSMPFLLIDLNPTRALVADLGTCLSGSASWTQLLPAMPPWRSRRLLVRRRP